jgi:hypothetical protein
MLHLEHWDERLPLSFVARKCRASIHYERTPSHQTFRKHTDKNARFLQAAARQNDERIQSLDLTASP